MSRLIVRHQEPLPARWRYALDVNDFLLRHSAEVAAVFAAGVVVLVYLTFPVLGNAIVAAMGVE